MGSATRTSWDVGRNHSSGKKDNKKEAWHNNERDTTKGLRMTLFASKHIKLGKLYICFGYNLKRLAVGFSIDRWSINLDLGPIWLSLEL